MGGAIKGTIFHLAEGIKLKLSGERSSFVHFFASILCKLWPCPFNCAHDLEICDLKLPYLNTVVVQTPSWSKMHL